MKQQLLGNEELKPLNIEGYEGKLFKVHFERGRLVKSEYDGKIKCQVHFFIREMGNWWNWGSFACDFSI